MKKINILFLLVCTLVLTNCSKEEEPTITDISVVSSENSISWLSNNDLTEKLNNALAYNYGDALESEIEKTLTFNSDSTKVAATIDFKTDFQDKYSDSNQDNNSVEISLEKTEPIIGKWQIVEITKNGVKRDLKGCGLKDFWEFLSDGKLLQTYHSPSSEEGKECEVNLDDEGSWEKTPDSNYTITIEEAIYTIPIVFSEEYKSHTQTFTVEQEGESNNFVFKFNRIE